MIADLDETTGTAAAAEVGGVFRQVNVADEDSVNALFDGVAADLGSVDIAFNNAGISPADDDSIETTELPAWDKVQDVNLKSVYLCSRAALRHMVPAGRGSIINTASFVALLGSATSQISYTASKGGVLAMTRELGVQFARQGIRVNALCPDPSTPRSCRSSSRKTPSARSAASCTCRWAVSRSRKRWPRPWPSWHPTMRPSSPRRPSWSTGASPTRTSRPCEPVT